MEFSRASICRSSGNFQTNKMMLMITFFPGGRSPKSFPMRIWKGLLRVRPIISSSHCFLISNGLYTRTWKDPRIPGLPLFKHCPNPLSSVLNPLSMGSDFIIPRSKLWNMGLLEQTFDHSSVAKILQIHLLSSGTSNRVIWTPESNDVFSVKSAYHTIFFDRLLLLGHPPLIN